MAWVNIVEETNASTWISLKSARGFVSPASSIETAASEAAAGTPTTSAPAKIRPALAAGLADGSRADANQRNYFRFGGYFGGARGGDKSTGVNCCVSQASMITDWRVPL